MTCRPSRSVSRVSRSRLSKSTTPSVTAASAGTLTLWRTAFSTQSALWWCSVARARAYAAASFSTLMLSMSGAAVAAVPGLPLGFGAGFEPPMLTGWAEPMFVPGAITAMSAASVMYMPADAARAPDGDGFVHGVGDVVVGDRVDDPVQGRD